MNEIKKSAGLSLDKKYRWWLKREWDDSKKACVFIGLNPSTADAENDDPTLRRCISFAKKWKCGSVIMVNLFAYRATIPAEMMKANDPIGGKCTFWIRHHCSHANTGLVILAWGTNGVHRNRDKILISQLPYTLQAYCLGLTKGGFPRHPLYVPNKTELIRI